MLGTCNLFYIHEECFWFSGHIDLFLEKSIVSLLEPIDLHTV